MAPKPKDWKLYERLVAAVQAKLATSDSEVTWNETVVGRSGTPRQLDVLVRGRVGTAPVTVVVECKEYAEHVGIEIVDAFVGKLKDVDGTQGILVARTGFTKPALMRAEQERIITAVLRPAKDEDWEGYLRSMCLRVVTKVLVHGELKVEDTDGTTRPAPGIVLLNGEGGVYRFLDREIDAWLSKNPWTPGAPISIPFDPPLVEAVSGALVVRAHLLPRYEEGIVNEVALKRPEDWIFCGVTLEGRLTDERSFLQFAELEQIARTFVPE